jgi:hypothetical protein
VVELSDEVEDPRTHGFPDQSEDIEARKPEVIMSKSRRKLS